MLTLINVRGVLFNKHVCAKYTRKAILSAGQLYFHRKFTRGDALCFDPRIELESLGQMLSHPKTSHPQGNSFKM